MPRRTPHYIKNHAIFYFIYRIQTLSNHLIQSALSKTTNYPNRSFSDTYFLLRRRQSRRENEQSCNPIFPADEQSPSLRSPPPRFPRNPWPWNHVLLFLISLSLKESVSIYPFAHSFCLLTFFFFFPFLQFHLFLLKLTESVMNVFVVLDFWFQKYVCSILIRTSDFSLYLWIVPKKKNCNFEGVSV